MRFLPASDAALLVELDDLQAAMTLHRALLAQPVAGVQDLVPAARTLLVHYHPWAISCPDLMDALRQRAAQAALHATVTAERLVEIPVRYDGEDLPEVAELLGISVREVIDRHSGQPWLGAFAGFAPGFVYLTGGHPCFHLPRRSTPRTRVPAGSVALAGDFSAVYPAASPGGWQLIGTTAIPMWDMARAEPAWVQPGFQVQFRDMGQATAHISLPSLPSGDSISRAEKTGSLQKKPATSANEGSGAVEIAATGVQTLLQDAGRMGMASVGLSPSGALDAAAMHKANRLVGNPVQATVLENLLGGLQLRCLKPLTVAVTGADAPLILQAADGRTWPVAGHQCVALDAGDTLLLGTPAAGVRCYVAVRGGWQVEAVLGSCSTDTLARLGPPALRVGQRLQTGGAHPLQSVQIGREAPPALPDSNDLIVLDVTLGPRTDWFSPESLHTFITRPWHVTPQSNRVGMRLQGAQPLHRSKQHQHDELPSEGAVTGAIQVPTNGQPVLFLADHPLTGGYPVIAALASHHLGLAAQIPVGCRIRFNVITPFYEHTTS